jgi:hypothetical protein
MPAGPYLIAMCDVLGFTRLVATTPLDEIHARYRALLAQLEPHPLFRIKAGTYAREIVLNRVVFSDMILLWAPAGEAMELLPSVLGQIMGRAMSSMPLRAGLAFGDCVIDPANELYVGQPIIDAYHTEQSQEWVGGAFHASCWRRPGLRDALCRGYEGSAVQYAVPVKAGAEPLEYALNWPALAGSDFTANALAASALAASDAATGPKVKWQNARRFYDAVVANRGSSR